MKTPYEITTNHLLTFPNWKELDGRLEIGFSTRIGGFSEQPYNTMNMGFHVNDDRESVIKNRMELARQLEFPLESWVSGQQVHGNQVTVVTKRDRGQGAKDVKSAIEGIDGIITRETGILCTAFFADCVPLFFYDPKASLIGIAHAGWKGTVHHIGPQMIDKMIEEGASKEDIRVLIGPAISQEHYEVDDAVIQHIPEELMECGVKSGRENRYLIDLHKINMEILLQYGILRHNIDKIDLCTYAENELFYSHRRDQGKTGRMLGYIGFKE